MPKKAGPKRIDPDSFLPTVLTPHGSETSFLICRRRWLRGKNVLGGPADAVFCAEYFSCPVAIQLTPKVEVFTGFQTFEMSWTVSKPDAHRISEACARVALAEAWHGVKATLDLGTFTVHVSSDVDGWLAHKKAVRLRNLIIALFWDRWRGEGLASGEIATLLSDSGYPCNARQVDKFVADHGFY
jgi:hypothetical protein